MQFTGHSLLLVSGIGKSGLLFEEGGLLTLVLKLLHLTQLHHHSDLHLVWRVLVSFLHKGLLFYRFGRNCFVDTSAWLASVCKIIDLCKWFWLNTFLIECRLIFISEMLRCRDTSIDHRLIYFHLSMLLHRQVIMLWFYQIGRGHWWFITWLFIFILCGRGVNGRRGFSLC